MNDDFQKNTPILPGLKPVLELLESDPARVDQVFVRKGKPSPDTDKVLDLCRAAGVRFALTPPEALARMAAGAGHQGVIARLREHAAVAWDDLLHNVMDAPLPLILALDQVQDPGNVGTLARTLYAMGGAGIVVPRHNSAFLGPGARRAAAGALERLPVAEVANLSRAVEDAARAGLAVHAATMDGESAFAAALRLPALLVLGGEEKGIRPGVLKHCAHSLSIPLLRDFDSLNVAQAGAILVSCFARAARA